MIGTAGRKAMEGMREGLQGLREGGGRTIGKMGIRVPLGGRRWLGLRPGPAALLAAAAAMAVAGLFLYLRKRRQVAEHYNMGGDNWEAASAGIEPAETFHA